MVATDIEVPAETLEPAQARAIATARTLDADAWEQLGSGEPWAAEWSERDG